MIPPAPNEPEALTPRCASASAVWIKAWQTLDWATRVFVIGVLLSFTAFALLRAMPINADRPENMTHVGGNIDRTVTRVFEVAKRNANRPFLEVKDHALYFKRNPALYQFVAELFIRAGAETPLPIQFASITLYNVGLLFCFLWLLVLFKSQVAACAGILFLAATPFLLNFATSIHLEPYAFAFSHIALFCFVRYLDSNGRRWLIAASAAYFVVCLNYWTFYISTYLLLLAVGWQRRRLSLRLAAIMATPAVLGVVVTIVQVAYARGWSDGLLHLVDVGLARTGDWRRAGATWHPDERFLTTDDLAGYPAIVSERVRLMMGLPLEFFVTLLIGLALITHHRGWREKSWLLLVFVAGLSWHLAMVQHTVIHKFSGAYGVGAWACLLAAFVDELHRSLLPERRRLATAAVAVVVAPALYGGTYAPKVFECVERALVLGSPEEAPSRGVDFAGVARSSRVSGETK